MNKYKKPKEIEIAAFFGNTTQTLRNYRDADDEKMNRRYEALRAYYIEQMEKRDERNS